MKQTLNVRFSGDQRKRETIYRLKLHYQQVQTTRVQWTYSNKTLIQSNLIVKRSLRKLNQITKKRSHFSNIIEWKTPADHWRGGSKWVGEGRVVTVHKWNKCPGWLYTQCKLQLLLFLFNYRRKKGLKHTIMWTPKSLKRGQTVFNNQWLTFNFLCQT